MVLKNKIVYRRHFATARNNIKRNRKRFLLPVISIFLTLTFVSFLISGILNVGTTVVKMTQTTQITALLDDKAPASVQTQLRTIEGVKNVKYSSKDEQLKQLSSLLSKDWQGFEGTQNPLQNSYVMDVSSNANVGNIEKRIQSISGVQLATDNQSNNQTIARNTTFITIALVVVGLATILFSATSIASVIEISLSSREKEIEIMRLLGATKQFVRFPFEIEGAYIGFVGAVLSVLVNVLGYIWFWLSFDKVLEIQGVSLIGVDINAVAIAIIILILGTFVGSMSARLRSNRLLEF
jgi:cell division transport system permease protein